MQGLMMQQQLMISDLIEHASNNHGGPEIFRVSVTVRIMSIIGENVRGVLKNLQTLYWH